MNFKRGKDPKRALGLGRTVLDDLKKHPIAKPMNDPWNNVDLHKEPDASVWINPHDQYCFNAMWCTPEILEQWMEGKGPMVKGKNAEEKKKYWDYAKFIAEDKDHIKWYIMLTWKYFDRFTTEFNPHSHRGFGMDRSIKKPIKIKNMRTQDHLENKIRTQKVIIDMLAPYIDEIVDNLEYSEWQTVKNKMESEFYGVKRTLYCLGVGYMGACNTPAEIENLNWVLDIVWGKAAYKYLKKKGEELPDFEWLSNKRHYED